MKGNEGKENEFKSVILTSTLILLLLIITIILLTRALSAAHRHFPLFLFCLRLHPSVSLSTRVSSFISLYHHQHRHWHHQHYYQIHFTHWFIFTHYECTPFSLHGLHAQSHFISLILEIYIHDSFPCGVIVVIIIMIISLTTTSH